MPGIALSWCSSLVLGVEGSYRSKGFLKFQNNGSNFTVNPGPSKLSTTDKRKYNFSTNVKRLTTTSVTRLGDF